MSGIISFLAKGRKANLWIFINVSWTINARNESTKPCFGLSSWIICTVLIVSPLVDNEWGFNLVVNSINYLTARMTHWYISPLLHLNMEQRTDGVTLSLRSKRGKKEYTCNSLNLTFLGVLGRGKFSLLGFQEKIVWVYTDI